MTGAYRMTLRLSGKTLPIVVLPEKITVKFSGKNETVTVLNLGEINVLRRMGLRELSWESFFPADLSLPVIDAGRAYAPTEYVEAIMVSMRGSSPKRSNGSLHLQGTDLGVNMPISVESFEYEERGGEVGDIYYKIKLKEWRDYSPVEIEIPRSDKPTGKAASPPREGSPARGGSHTVVAGDCLWAIAQAYYGDGSRYPEIYAANKTAIDAGNKGTGNPKYTIYPGQVFIIP